MLLPEGLAGEEGGALVGSDPRFRWIVDPLDGTTNYAHGFPFFCVSIGLEVEGRLMLGVAYAPTLDELYVAEAGRGALVNDRPIWVSGTSQLSEGLLATGFPYDRAQFPRALKSFEVMSMHSQAVRRAGSAVLDLCYVACGRLDGYWEHLVKPWDIAAGALMKKYSRNSPPGGTPEPAIVVSARASASGSRVSSTALASAM